MDPLRLGARLPRADHWHPTLVRIVRRLRPSAESFAAAAAVYAPDLMLQSTATPDVVDGPEGEGPFPEGRGGRSRGRAHRRRS